jgi:hypothetical protein
VPECPGRRPVFAVMDAFALCAGCPPGLMQLAISSMSRHITARNPISSCVIRPQVEPERSNIGRPNLSVICSATGKFVSISSSGLI